MTENREEIRWKLSLLSELITVELEQHEGERKELEEKSDKYTQALFTSRNTAMAGIGFVIALWISLISIGAVPTENAWYIIIGIVAAAIIFFGINLLSYKIGDKYYSLDTVYRKYTLDMLNIKGWALGVSMKEDVNFSQILTITNFINVFVHVIAFSLQTKANELLNYDKPKLKDFRQYYEIAKNYNDQFKMLGLPNQNKEIETFMRKFETKK